MTAPFSSFRPRPPAPRLLQLRPPALGSLRARAPRAFTLAEAAIGLSLLAVILLGLLASLVQSRRQTEATLCQGAVTTVIQGYLEQIKNLEFASLPYLNSSGSVVAGAGSTAAEIPTRADEATMDTLTISTGAIPALDTVTWGTTPTGIADNPKQLDLNLTTANTADNLSLNLWVWIQDLSDTAQDATQVRAITIVYQWQFKDGARTRSFKSSLRTIRSAVPTF